MEILLLCLGCLGPRGSSSGRADLHTGDRPGCAMTEAKQINLVQMSSSKWVQNCYCIVEREKNGYPWYGPLSGLPVATNIISPPPAALNAARTVMIMGAERREGYFHINCMEREREIGEYGGQDLGGPD